MTGETPNPLQVLRDVVDGRALWAGVGPKPGTEALDQVAKVVETTHQLREHVRPGPARGNEYVGWHDRYRALLADLDAALVPFAAHKDTNHASPTCPKCGRDLHGYRGPLCRYCTPGEYTE